VRDLLLNYSDRHHVYPRNHLKNQRLTPRHYNQIANFVLTRSEINIRIGGKAPAIYFADLIEKCNGEPKKYGGITELDDLRTDLAIISARVDARSRYPCLWRVPQYASTPDGDEDQDLL